MIPSFRWLGAAGIELTNGKSRLVIDPFFTRPPFWRLWMGKVPSNALLIARYMQPYRYIFITHSHFDHLMDVPEIGKKTGADIYGSQNTCRLLSALGLPLEQVHKVQIGDRLNLEGFSVDVFPARHPRTPIDWIINSPLLEKLEPPLRLMDYRMDIPYSFRVHFSGLTALHGNYPAAADILFSSPLAPISQMEPLIPKVSPKVIVPIHWDDFFRPLSQPVRPVVQPPSYDRWSLRPIDLSHFQQMIEEKYPGVHVLIPDIFKSYSFPIPSQNNVI